jgi:biopolymer transport protein ExbD
MKCLLSVCLAVAAGVATHAINDVAQTPAPRKGISVQMAVTGNATPMPEADNADAWIVSIPADGQLYFGIDPVTPQELRKQLIRHPRNTGQKLYIKADAQAPYGSLQKVLDAAGNAEFATPVLLVNQQGSVQPGTMVPPKGLEVLIDGSHSTANAVVVEVVAQSQQPPTVRINHEPIPWDALESRLAESIQSNHERSVQVKADGRAAFADVARVIDACSAMKVKPVLSALTL